MLIRITNKCNMHCSHCLSDSNPNGPEMTKDVFFRAYSLSLVLDTAPIFFISGGEPTQHTNLVHLLKRITILNHPEFIVLLSNGSFLEDEKYSKEILDLGICVQVTNDRRFYPKDISHIEHKRIFYSDRIALISPFGRAKNNPKIAIDKKAPGCFNLRSALYTTGNIRSAIATIRQKGYMCTPSINVDGSIVAGEAPECGKIGTVNSSIMDIDENLKNLKCDKCNQHKNLDGLHLQLWDKINRK